MVRFQTAGVSFGFHCLMDEVKSPPTPLRIRQAELNFPVASAAICYSELQKPWSRLSLENEH
jgi:hypothetical protein